MKHLEPEAIELAAKAAADGDVATHLAACADCRAQVKSARARQRLLGGLKPYTLSDLAFRRVEARLDEAVAHGDVSRSSWRWLGWVAGAVALAAVTFVVTSREPQAGGVVAIPQPNIAVAPVPFHALVAVRASADAQVRSGAAAWRELVGGAALHEGDALSGEAVTLAASDAAWRFVTSGSLSLGGAASVTLGAGEVIADVGAPVEVLASSRRFAASDALFAVSRVAAEVVLQVSRGEVEVLDSVTGQRRKVKAPEAVRWSDGSALADGRDEPARALTAPAVPAQPWVPFDASSLTAGSAVSLDGVALGRAPFIELVTSGRRRLSVTPPSGPVRESWAELVAGAPYVASLESAPELPAAEPDEAALTRVMSELKSQRPKLAACYEKWLKANPQAQGEVVLELTVSAQGRVKRARLESGTVSAPSAECLVTTAKSLVLSPLGVDATLQVPLLLRHGAR